MAGSNRTQGVEVEKYEYLQIEDPQAAEKEAGKAWNHRKLKKVVMNDYILSYQELLEMLLVYEAQVEDFENDLEINEEKRKVLLEKLDQAKNKVKEWKQEIAQVEKDIPEIGQQAAAERKVDAEKKAKHEANLRGEGEGRAFEATPDGQIKDVTGTKK